MITHLIWLVILMVNITPSLCADVKLVDDQPTFPIWKEDPKDFPPPSYEGPPPPTAHYQAQASYDNRQKGSFVRETIERSGELKPGGSVRCFVVNEYERQDRTTYREKGEHLYDLYMREERIAAGNASVCEHEWHIISQMKKKLRHKRRHYSVTHIVHITTKRMAGLAAPLGGNSTLDEEVSRVVMRKILTPGVLENETPECGSLGRHIPGDYIVG